MPKSSKRPAAKMQRQHASPLDRISWDDLRLFVVAAREGSFRKAGLALRTSSSTLTRRIERLEHELGIRLFDRLPEGVATTALGAQVLRSVQEMEKASLSLRKHLDRDLTTRGIVRCTVTEGLGTFWILPQLADFTRANPYTVVDLQCTMEPADVLRHESDIGIQFVRPTAPDLVVQKIGRLHIYPFASRRYIDTYGAPRTREDILQHRVVDQISPQFREGTVPAYLGLETIEGVVSMRTNASTAHFYAVELGIGIGGLPTYAAALGADVEPLDLGFSHHLDIFLAYRPDVRDIPRIAVFLEWLRSIFDPGMYPWFRDEFIHPRMFRGMEPKVKTQKYERTSVVSGGTSPSAMVRKDIEEEVTPVVTPLRGKAAR